MCDAPPDTATTPMSVNKPTESNINTPFDPSYYTWSLLFRSLIGQAPEKDVKKYIHNQSIVNEERDCKRCEKWRDWLFQYSPVVHFLRQNVEKLGGELNGENVVCKRCDTLSPTGVKQGAFSGDLGILLCANHIRSRKNLEEVLSHEMVHAYDFMRFKYDKWNLKHAACTEIRANLLSGECRWAREFFKNGHYKFTQHFQDCVRRRAVLAVKMHGACEDDVQAVRTVNEVWESCFPDTRPFDEVYR